MHIPIYIQKFVKDYRVLLLILLLIVNFARLIYTEFGYSDSYDFLLNADNPHFYNRWVQSGRLLFGLGASYIFTTFDVSSLYIIRLFSLIGAVLFVSSTYLVFKKYFSEYAALLMAILISFSPSITVLVLWTSTYQVSWALFFGVLAGNMTLQILDNKLRYGYFLVVIMLSILSLNLYQPGFTAFILPAFAYYLSQKNNFKKIALFIIVHLILYGVYYCLFKLSLIWFDLKPEGRGGLNLDILDSLQWIIKHPFKQASFFTLIFTQRWIQMVFFCLMISAFLLTSFIKSKRNYLRFFYSVAMLTTFYILSILPNFLAEDNFVSYRMLTVMLALNAVIVVWLFMKIKGRKLSKYLSCAFTAVVVFCGYYNTNQAYINIQSQEYEIARSFVLNLDASVETLYVIPPSDNFLVKEGIVKRVVTDEFGKLSNSIPWVTESFFELLLQNHGKSAKVIVTDENAPKNVQANEAIYDCERQWRLSNP